MDTFAYISLGLCAVCLLVWGGAWLVSILSDPLGRGIALALGIVLMFVCGVVSAVWLIGTKLI